MRRITTIIHSFVIILPSFAFLNFNKFESAVSFEPILLISFSILTIMLSLWFNPPSCITKFEFTFLLFILFLSARAILPGFANFVTLAKPGLIIALYLGIKSFIATNKIKWYAGLLFWNTTTVLCAWLLISIYIGSTQDIIAIYRYFTNSSIFSMLLSSLIAFILPLYFYLGENGNNKSAALFRWLFYLLIFLCIILLIFTNGRGGWIGGFLSIVYILYCYQTILKFKKYIIYFSLSSLVIICPILFWFKSGSSSGRLLIYKISGEIFKRNWLFGIGNGQFKVLYNQYQAEYFASNIIDGKEAQLADNSFYAFNDFFQVGVENGIIGFLLLVTLLYSLVFQIKQTVVTAENKHLFIAANASLICIVIGALLSYPLQTFPIMVQATLCLAIINSFEQGKITAFKFPKIFINISKITLLIFSVLLFIHFGFYLKFKMKSNEAFELKRAGFKQKSFKKYAALSNSYIKDGYTLYLYAQELYYRNELIKARQVLNIAKKHYCSNEVYKLSATIENELQNFDQAEKDYKTALYMVPNRMISRNNLLDFYMERKDTVNAIYWANSILTMPVKVPSKITQNIQQKAKKDLLQLSK